MYEQPKYEPGAPSVLFADGNSSRTPPAGSLAVDSGLIAEQSTHPPETTLSSLKRGQERFDIYCAPCHGESGDGAGMVVQRGFPAPPSFHIEQQRAASDRHLFDVISFGYGVMYPYADRIAPEDRWAIVAYIRALQLSQNAPLERLAPADMDELGAAGATR